MAEFTPTNEQVAIVEASKKGNVVVDSVAGGSKTTTLTLVAKAHPDKKTLYWAFNKAAAEEAKEKFPSHVDCKTQHGVAYAKTGLPLAHKLNRPKGRYVNVAGTGGEIARFYRLEGYDKLITAGGVGLLVRSTVQRFEQSADAVLSGDHLPWIDIDELVRAGAPNNLSRLVLAKAKDLWSRRIDPSSEVLATHDTYLKLFQLSKPVLPYGAVLLDEAQDTTLCVLDIFNNQKDSLLALCGDNRQAIYTWRGSVNAMGLTGANFQRMNLSQSFRYGPAIASVARDILKGEMDVKGFTKIESVVGDDVVDKEKPYTILYRTNAVLLAEAVDHLDQLNQGLTDKQIKIDIDVRDFVKMLQSSQALYEDRLKDVKHEVIVPYPTFAELLEAGEEDPELKRIGAIVAGGRGNKVIDLLEFYTVPQHPHITFTTAHKSKGLEYKQVVLADDFPSHYDQKGKWKGLSKGEENLLYVAATRAIDRLNTNSSVREAISYMKNPYRKQENYAFKNLMHNLANEGSEYHSSNSDMAQFQLDGEHESLYFEDMQYGKTY